jgi:hypothetical protein
MNMDISKIVQPSIKLLTLLALFASLYEKHSISLDEFVVFDKFCLNHGARYVVLTGYETHLHPYE